MSHQNTPRLYNKTPGSISSENIHPNFGINNNSTNQKPVMDASMSISDLQATNAKQLLNAYVYDFLIKSRLPQTAKIFVNEAEVPSVRSNNFKKSPQNPNSNPNTPQTPKNLQQMQKDNNLPNLSMAMDAPQGFLFEWWQVFWDVFQAKNNRGSSNFASQYYQMQMLKQRQQHELQGLNVNPVGMPNTASFPGQLQPHQIPPHAASIDQQIQQGQIPQHQGQLQPSQPPQPIQPPQAQQHIQQAQHPHPHPDQFQQLQQQQQQRMMIQMMMKQQQQQQQSQILAGSIDPSHQVMGAMNANNIITNPQQPPNKIQQHAQSQMNNLRQQAAVQQQGQQESSNKSTMTGQRMNQMTPQGSQAQQPMNGMHQFQSPQMMNNSQVQGSFSPLQISQQSVAKANTTTATNNNNNNNQIVGQNGENPIIGLPSNNNSNRNMNALQDYQKQLMLLEKQNKKRLDIARKNEGGNPTTIINTGMLPPTQGQQTIQHKPSPVGSLNSPLLNSKSSPSSAGGKKKKDSLSKRSRKPSNPNIGTVNVNGANSSTNLKKEFSTPLTPASDNDSKRKRKSATSSDSPKKQANKNSVLGNSIKEKENSDTADQVVKDDIAPSELIQDSVSQADQIFSVEILGNSSSEDQNFFNPNGQGNGGLDDIEFDFKQFLDNSGDSRLNEGMAGFNWGSVDAIEKND